MAEAVKTISMDDILSDKEPAPAEPVERKAPPVSEPLVIPVLGEKPVVERPRSSRAAHREREQLAQGRVRDPETGQYAPKTEAEPEVKGEVKPETKPETKPEVKPAAPQQEFTDKEKAFMRGMEEERRKRQELEKRLVAIEAAKVESATTEAPKTFWDDPEGAFAKQQADIAKQLAEFRSETTTARLNTAEYISRREHKDFDEKIAVFANLVKETPGLYQQWMAAPDPAEFAYGIGKNHMELQEAGTIEGLRDKIKKETRIELEAELKEKAEALAKERAALPPSLSEARSVGQNKVTWAGVPSMEEILKG